jgi:CRP-like cAMP-binding protein
MNEDTDQETQERISILRKNSIFQQCDDIMLEQLASKCQMKYYDKNQKLVEKNKSNEFLYWILKGQVKLEKEIRFIEHQNAHHLVRPDTADYHIKKYEKRVEEKVCMGMLLENQYFPEVLPPSIQNLDPSFDRFDLVQKLSDLDQIGYNQSTVTVTTMTPVECLCIQRIDFVRIMTWTMFAAMKREGFLFYLPVLLHLCSQKCYRQSGSMCEIGRPKK